MIRERGIVLEICPTSNLNTRVVSGWDEFRWIFDTFRRNDVRFTINTDGPEMLKTYIRDELATLGRLGILSVEEQEQVAATSMAASFVPNVSDVPADPSAAGARARSSSAKRPRAGSPRSVPDQLGRVDPVGAAAVARRDVRLADHVRRRGPRGTAPARPRTAAVRAASDVSIAQLCSRSRSAPSVADHGLGEVAALVLDHRRARGRGPRAVAHPGSALGHPAPHPVADLAPPGREDLLDEVVAADRLDRRQQAGREAAVVGREEAPGRRR